MKLKKILMCNDVHHGRRNNERQHNQDCLDYFDWVCSIVKSDPTIDHIGFLGDWYESRNSINIETLEYSYKSAKKLSSLGLPVIFVPGNHDLHLRTSRDVHSVRIFNELPNFKVIDQPELYDDALFLPFIFPDEYEKVAKIKTDVVFGHLEFKGFMMTSYNTIVDHGPDSKLFKDAKKVFTGHFHKRQAKDNIVYNCNTFPMDWGDVGDKERGCAVYDRVNDAVTFYDWADCPRYEKRLLSDVLSSNETFHPKTYLKVLVDTSITHTEAQDIRESIIQAFNLRSVIIEEISASDAVNMVVPGQMTVNDGNSIKFNNVDEMIISMLNDLGNQAGLLKDITNLDLTLLVDIYKGLKIETKAD